MHGLRLFVRPLAALLLTAGGIYGVADAKTITSVSQVRALADEDYARGETFCLTGLVISSRSAPKGCFLETAEGNCCLWSTNLSFREGQYIRANGYTALDFFADDPILHTTNAVILGERILPDPQLLSLQKILSGAGDYRRIRVRGFITDAFNDDIDEGFAIALVNVSGRIINVMVRKTPAALRTLQGLANADVELVGICIPRNGGKRVFGGPCILLDSVSDDIRVLSPPDADPFSAPPLKVSGRVPAESISSGKRVSVHGRVLAAWQGRHLLMTYGNGQVTRLTLSDGEPLPAANDWIDAIGFPQTDLFSVNLTNVRTRKTTPEPVPSEDAEAVSARRICHHPVTGRYDHDFHGRLIRLTGRVLTKTDSQYEPGYMTVESEDTLVRIDAGTSLNAFADAEIGSVVEATGICVLESENWRPQRIFPTISGLTVVLRAPGDLHILSHPPWWTPRRFLFALAGLVLALIAILIWNAVLRKLIERRSRELTRAQAAQLASELRIDERTRIAAELHDYLAQNLTAVSYKLSSARATRGSDPVSADAQLETAAAMLDSSRTELRRCLWDLRSKALEEPTFNLAIRRSLQQITDLKNLDLTCNIPRSRVSDPTAHAILSVIRELVANAVNHGRADHIAIRGEIAGDALCITVADNGSGFDIDKVASSDDGHFGLDGIRQRIKRLDGSFELSSSLARGTKAVIRLPLHATHESLDP